MNKLYIAPQEFMDHHIVLGAISLKENNLLPDMTSRELIHREQNTLTILARDISRNIHFYNCITTDSVLVPPNQCKLISVVVPHSSDRTMDNPIIEFNGVDHPVLEFIPGILDIREKTHKIAVLNLSEKEQYFRKHTLIGKVTPFNGALVVPINSNQIVLNSENMGNYWTPEKLMEEFGIEDLPLTKEQQHTLINILLKHSNALSCGDNDVGIATNITHHIDLETNKPIRVPVRRFQGPLAQEIEGECKALLESNIIRPSQSPYSAPVVPVRKPDGKLRLCIDYRKLNEATKTDSFPLPNLIDMIYNMYGQTFFSTIDLRKGYYQVNMDPESIEKTAFSTPFAQYEYLKMPFGVKNGPATFQRGMMLALAGLPWTKVMVYLDDIIVLGKTIEEHLNTLQQVLAALEANGYKLKPIKTKLCRKKVEFLGHHISKQGIMPLEKNLSGALNFPIPSTVKQLRQFLGMVNFYRRHIPNCSSIAKPLSCQTGGRTVQWTGECQEAFEKLKSSLVDPRLLAFPDYSLNSPPLELFVDASDIGAGAVLSQQQGDDSRPIAFISMTFSDAQLKYSTVERELAALRWAVKALRPFLCNEKKIIIYSDHEPLQYLHNMSAADGRIARTLNELSAYNFEIRHISGNKNILADALSRSPVPAEDLEDCNGMVEEVDDCITNQSY